jgi:hypothetical protein
MRWVKALRNKGWAAAFIVALGLFLWAFVHLLDAGGLIDDARVEAHRRENQALLLQSMLNHVVTGMSRTELLRLLAPDLSASQVVKTFSDRVEIDNVVIRFRDDKVERVHFLGQE